MKCHHTTSLHFIYGAKGENENLHFEFGPFLSWRSYFEWELRALHEETISRWDEMSTYLFFSLLMDEFPSLHYTLLTLLPPRSPCVFTSHRVHWTWLGLMPWRCWCPAHSSSLPPSAWWIMEVWIVVHAYHQLFIHSVIFIKCVLTLMIPSGHMASILPSILERDPPLLLSWRLFFIFGEFFLIRCEVKGQGCRMCTDCKALWGKCVICDIGLYKINWIEWDAHRLSSGNRRLHPAARGR